MERVFIVGGSGTGKTTLAREIGSMTGLPVHHLDEVAIEVGETSARVELAQEAAIAAILAERGWVAEGIHLGWTEPLAQNADLIVWLDHLSWWTATRRILRRFVAGALTEIHRQKGLRKFTRFRDYGRHLRDLAGAIPESRAYHTDSSPAGAPRFVSRSLTEQQLAPYRNKVLHCQTAADVRTVPTLVLSGRTSQPGELTAGLGPNSGDIPVDESA